MSITADQAIFLLHASLPSFENEHRITLKVMKAVPADKGDYKPDVNSMSAADLVRHIADCEKMFMGSILAGEFTGMQAAQPQTIEETIRAYAENWKRDVAAIKALSGEQLAKIIDFRGMLQLPAVGYLNLMASHTIHHRGQLSVYLRPMGAKVPSMYGESYDDKQARTAAAQ